MRMAFDICVGFGPPLVPARTVYLNASNVGQTGSYVGANHVLHVDQHFHDYVELQNWAAFPALPHIPGFPHRPTFTAVASKKHSPDIAGTLGEGATAIVIKRLAQLRTVDIVTLEVSRTAKTPDFAARLPAQWLANAGIAPPIVAPVSPQWWPVESKACQQAGNRMSAAAWRGFQQLVSYWKRIRGTSPGDVGFGIVVVFKYDNLVTSPPRVRAHVFLPQNQLMLLNRLALQRIVSRARKSFENGNIIHGV